MPTFTPSITQRQNRPSSIAQAIRTGKLRNGRGTDNGDIIILGTGQSNIANWSSSSYANAGENNLLSSIDSFHVGIHDFVNAGNGGSYLLKSAYDAANTRNGGSLEANDYWLDDSGATLVAGQRLLDAMNDVSTASYDASDITIILWSQGESDAAELHLSNITIADYYDGLVWLKDYCFSNFPHLRKFMIRPLGRRAAGSVYSYDAIRKKQQELAANFPTQVRYGSEIYDQPMLDESGATDYVHRSAGGYTVEGQRTGREVLSIYNLYYGNTAGPRITSATYNGTSIVCTVTHDQGTALTNRAGTAYSGTPINITPSGTGLFSLVDAAGSTLPITSVNITGASEITIVTSVTLTATGNTLRYGYNHMLGVDLDSAVFDNHADNPLPLQASYSTVIDGALNNIANMSALVSFFTPESTYNAGGTASDAVVWTKRAGSGSSARKDDAKPAPTYYSDISTYITGAPALAGWVFDGTASQKLLVEHALTTSSNYTVFLVCTPDDVHTEAASGSTANGILTTAGASSGDGGLFTIRQSRDAHGTMAFYAGTAGSTVDNNYNHTPAVLAMRNTSGSVQCWNNSGVDTGTPITLTSPIIDTDGGTPIFAIGNSTDKTSGDETNSSFYGAIHYIAVFSSSLNDVQVKQIRKALGEAVGVSIS